MRYAILIALFAGTLVSDPSCAVTEPPQSVFVPPPPFNPAPELGAFYFGSDDFWTILPDNGVWQTQHDQPTYDRRKISWFSKGFFWLSGDESNLKVKARKVDGSYEAVDGGRATNGFIEARQESFMLSSIEFPSTGCWEITAQFHGQELKFTLLVTAPSNSSSASLKK
jgi:hypothetical protein